MDKDVNPLIYEDQDGNLFGYWQLALAYIDWLGTPSGLEEFKQTLLSRGVTQQEIDEELAISRQFKQ